MLHIKVVGKIETQILCSINFSSENRVVYEIMWKIWYSQTGFGRQYKTTYALSMQDT